MDYQASVATTEEEQNLSQPKLSETLPYPPTEANIPKLKEYLVKELKSLVFEETRPYE